VYLQCEWNTVWVYVTPSFRRCVYVCVCVCSYRRQFKRLRALLNPAEPQPTALKGQALCYNASTGRLVSYNARQRILSVLLEDGTIRSEVSRARTRDLRPCTSIGSNVGWFQGQGASCHMLSDP
jgi:hypothetical protein